MAVQSLTITNLKMFNQYGVQITSGLPHKIEITADIKTGALGSEALYGKVRAYLQTRLNNVNGIVIQSGGNASNSAGDPTVGYYTQGTINNFNDGKNTVTATFVISNFAKSVFQKITEGYDFNNNNSIKEYIKSLSKTDGSAAYSYSNFYFNILVCNNYINHTGVDTEAVPSGNNIYVPNISSQFSAPEALRTTVYNSLTLSASNNSSNLIYSPVIQNNSITGYKQRTDCLVGKYVEKTGTRPVYTLIKWKNTSRLIFSKGFYDNLITLRRPGASIGNNYISHSFPITKLQIKLICYKSIGTSSTIDYTNTFIIDPLTELKQNTDNNYYYEFTNDDIINFSSGNSSDSYDYLTRQGLVLNIGVNLELVDINGRQDSSSTYWGSGTVKLVILNPNVQNTIQYTQGIKSDLTLTKATSDNNILYCDQKANSYTINIPAASTNENYIIYNYKISFYIKNNNKKIELWRGYGLPDSKNTSSLPTAMQSSNANNKIKSNNLFSVSFTKEALNNKIITALGSQSHYNGLSGDELWEGYFIIESVLGNDYNIIDNDSDIKVTTSKQIGSLLLSNNYTKIDGNALKLTVTKHKLENNIKRETEVEYVFNQSKESIQNAQGNAVGYVNSDETATFKQFAFLHYKDVTYTNLKLTIQDLSYNDALTSRKWELNFNSSSNLIRGLNNNTTQVTGSNGLTYSRYSYNINQSYLSNSGYNSSFYYVIAGSIFTVEVTFTYGNKTYSETHSTKRYRKIVFCNVDRNRFNSVVELKQYIAKNDSKNSIEVQFSEDFLDIGGALSYNQQEPYNSWYQNFYFNGNNGKIERVITAQYKEDNVWKNLRIGDSNSTVKSENAFEFDKIMTAIPSSPKTHTITIHKDTSEKIFGEVRILITYYLRDGAYYSEYAVGSTISDEIQAKSREIYFNTASPTIYKRPFSVGIDQIPGDEEVLRIDIPDADSSKKYIALGDNLLIDLTDGSFYIYAGSSATKPGAGTIYLTATIPEQDYNTDETKIVINNSIPFREKVGIPEKHKKIYKKYSKKTSF